MEKVSQNTTLYEASNCGDVSWDKTHDIIKIWKVNVEPYESKQSQQI